MAFDKTAAVNYGRFVAVAYAMHAADLTNPAPKAPAQLPDGYKFIAWVQMRDFFFESGNWAFYGIVAQSPHDANTFVLAIRGTIGLEEWWDDLTSLVPAPWIGVGNVGYGFNRIYQTLRIVDATTHALAAEAAPSALAGVAVASFAEQVAAITELHAPTPPAGPQALAAVAPIPKHVNVVGHSLGAALATLYVAENAAKGTKIGSVKVNTPLLCTFASPRVGDTTFAQNFDGLGVTSWRVVNELDVVPYLPPIGFQHVKEAETFNSGRHVRWSLGCWHSLGTYLHLLDPNYPLDKDCVVTGILPFSAQAQLRAQPAAMAAAAAPAAIEKALTVAPGGRGTTITIKITVGDGD